MPGALILIAAFAVAVSGDIAEEEASGAVEVGVAADEGPGVAEGVDGAAKENSSVEASKCGTVEVLPSAASETPRYSFGGAAGWMSWGTAYGGEENGLIFRLQGRRRLGDLFAGGDWLSLGAVLDTSWLHENTNQLDFLNTQTFVGLTGGVLRTFGRFRLQLDVESGALLQTSRIHDQGGRMRHGFRASPTVAILGGGGLAYRDVAVALVQGGTRWRSGRLDIQVFLGIEWFI